MARPEQQTQLAICEWLAFQYPEPYNYLVKIDNEGKRTVGGHVLAKRMGLHTGASDLFLAWPTIRHYGLWMEIKHDKWKGPASKKERLHYENQLEFLSKMSRRGYFSCFVVGVDQAIDAFNTYFKNTAGQNNEFLCT